MSEATAVQAILATCQQRGIVLAVAGEKLTVDAPEGTLTPDLLTELRQHKAGLIDVAEETAGLGQKQHGRPDDRHDAALPDTDMVPWDECIEPPDPCPKVWQPDDLVGCVGRTTLHDLRQTKAPARESSGTAGTGRTITPVRRPGEFFSTRPLTFSAIDRN